MGLFKKIPFFLILLVLFFCLHGWLENYGSIRPAELVYPALGSLAAILLLTGVIFLFTKNLLFASLLSFFISLWYLFFGVLHDAVKSMAIPAFFKSYSLILPLLLLLTVCVAVFLKRKKKIHPKLVFYLNLLLLIYCVVDCFLLIRMQANDTAKPQAAKFNNAGVIKKPDVYLLLFDGYPGYKSIKDSFGFSNDSLRHYFAKHGFTTFPLASNYDLTYFSMSSLFNMKYVTDDYDNMNISQRDFQKRGVEINRGAVFSIFRAMGYDISNLSVFEVNDQPPVSDKNSFVLAHAVLITDKMLHNRMKRDIGQRLAAIIPFWKNNGFYQHDNDNQLTETLLLQTATKKKDKPLFTYAHFMMPHGPYYYDSLGNKNLYKDISHHTMWQNKALFVSYVKYVNSRLVKMVDTIISSNPHAIILIMGDHGFRAHKGRQLYQPSRYNTICEIRFAGNKLAEPKPVISSVNLFPYIFNAAYGQNIAYLQDSSIVLRYQ